MDVLSSGGSSEPASVVELRRLLSATPWAAAADQLGLGEPVEVTIVMLG
jgi:hypothetical protein